MESFEEQFADHAVHDVLSQLATSIENTSERDLGEDALNSLSRIRQGHAFIRDRIEIASPVLSTTAQLDRIRSAAQACTTQINQFIGNGNVGHLTNASNEMNAGISVAATLICLEQPTPQVKASDAVGFKTLAENVISSLREKVSEVGNEGEEVSSQLTQIQANIEAETERLTTLHAQVETKLEQLENAFTEAQSQRETAFNNLVSEVERTNEEKLAEFSESADDKISYIDDKREEAARSVSLIGNIGITGNFRGAATREGRSANIFRAVALLCFLGMVCVILYMGFVSLHEKFDVWLAVFRFAIGFAFLVPGVYAAKESSKHRHLENRNRKAELELASIDNYLDSLPDDKRYEIKAELTAKYFGGKDEESTAEDIITSKSMFKLFSEVMKALAAK